MAFNPRIIPATDFQPNVGVGVNLPFSQPQVFTSNFTSTASLKNNIINYFLTEPGERLDNPLFGGGLRNFIFEQITDNNLLRAGPNNKTSTELRNRYVAEFQDCDFRVNWLKTP